MVCSSGDCKIGVVHLWEGVGLKQKRGEKAAERSLVFGWQSSMVDSGGLRAPDSSWVQAQEKE